MFFLGKDKKLICDDLTIRPYTLKTLRKRPNSGSL